MKILVTGGAGFIGSAVIRYLLDHTDDSVVNVDALTYAASPASLEPFAGHSRYAFEHVNICDAPSMAAVLSRHRPDAIMHLAAESHVDRSIDGPAAFIQSNIVGTYTLLEAARAYWAALDSGQQQRFRFHHVSTDEVFGDLADSGLELESDLGFDYGRDINRDLDSDLKPDLGLDRDWNKGKNQDINPDAGPGIAAEPALREPFTENSPYRPSSPYSASKAASDHLVRAWARTYGLPVLISHCSNNYGPWQYPEKLIPLVIRLARDEQHIPLYGDGLQVRDWLYVDDHARALALILKQGEPGQTYNVSASEERCNLDVVRAICDHLDYVLGDRQRRKLITHVADRPGHDRRYALNASRLKRKMAWHPQETFESGLRKTVQWYLETV